MVRVTKGIGYQIGSKMGVSHTWNRFGRRDSGAKVLQPVRVAGAQSISEAQQGLGSAPKGFSPSVPGASSVSSWDHTVSVLSTSHIQGAPSARKEKPQSLSSRSLWFV